MQCQLHYEARTQHWSSLERRCREAQRRYVNDATLRLYEGIAQAAQHERGARLAYNVRDQFDSSASRGGSIERALVELSEEDNDVALGAVAALTYAYKNDPQAKAMFVERLTAEVF